MNISKKGTRLSNSLLDSVILFFILWGLSYEFSALGIAILDGGLFDFPSLIFAFLYYYFFELALSRTPAKFITTTLVVDANGGKPTAIQILIRPACRFIPFEALSFVFTKGLHDAVSKTEVIDV